MQDIISNSYTQFGVFTIMLALMFFFSKQMFNEQVKMLREKNKEQRDLEAYIREYMVKQNAEHHQIISRNTEAFEKMIEILQQLVIEGTAGGIAKLRQK